MEIDGYARPKCSPEGRTTELMNGKKGPATFESRRIAQHGAFCSGGKCSGVMLAKLAFPIA